MKTGLIAIILAGVFLFGCSSSEVKPQQTQLQIRQFQTKEFQDVDTMVAMKAMLNVLQDDGFIINNAVPQLGLLTAEKQIDIKDPSYAFMSWFFRAYGYEAKWEKVNIIDCTANVSEFGKGVRVRVTFHAKILDNKGGIMKLEQISDEKFYQEFFAKVDKGIFIQKEKI